MSDKKITCRECHTEFDFTVGEQEWYQENNLQEPKRCKECRDKRRQDQERDKNKTREN
ncbi:MAG: cytochrome C551 [Bacilli bacterium]|nr:cytochrome C551 [Bacilli bacterium]